jgi:Zn-dependent metalloprotease
VKNVRRRAAKHPKTQKLRKIYNANNSNRLPGSVARSEGDPPTGDIAVDETYNWLGITYDFFRDVYKRNSIDDKGMPLNAVVHYGERYNNTIWNGKYLVIGDGDGQLFNRFTASIDVIANQLVHGMIEVEAHLEHWHQSGALAESISDVFGSLVKQYFLKQTPTEADWLIGAGLLNSKVKGIALRSLASPGTAYDDPATLGKDPQPAHMRNYLRTTDDSGGVHINSGIPNHAFYLVAKELGGYAWEKAGVIWYETLRDKRLKPKAQFRDFARLTLAKARQLYGGNSFEAKAVKRSWGTVGIKLRNP